MNQRPKHDQQWAKAKRICRLNTDDIAMAKALGMSLKTLMKNNPSPTQRWKLPVKLWIRELHANRFGHKVASTTDAAPLANPAVAEPEFDENIPF